MKRLNIKKPVIGILAAAVIIVLLSACSGVIGGDYNVRISVPQLASGSSRYISPAATSGYIVVLQENKVYSLNNFSDKAYQEFVNGNVYIANLPVGDYIFGIVLLDDSDENVGLAIKKREIKKGFNDIVIDVGPGISTLTIQGNPLPFEDIFKPDEYPVMFADNSIILDIDRNIVNDALGITFNPVTGTWVGEKIVEGVSTGGPVGAGPWSIEAAEDGIDITISGGPDLGSSSYTLKIILK